MIGQLRPRQAVPADACRGGLHAPQVVRATVVVSEGAFGDVTVEMGG